MKTPDIPRVFLREKRRRRIIGEILLLPARQLYRNDYQISRRIGNYVLRVDWAHYNRHTRRIFYLSCDFISQEIVFPVADNCTDDGEERKGSLTCYHYLRLCYRENATCSRGNFTIKFSGCYEGTAIAAHILLYLLSVSACNTWSGQEIIEGKYS